MFIFAAIVALFCLGLLAFHYWRQVFHQESALGDARFGGWLLAGLVVPSASWLLLNAGILLPFPPMIPAIAIAQSKSLAWLEVFDRLTCPGLLVIGSFWAAVTFAEFVTVIATQTEARAEFALIAGLFGFLALPLVWLLCSGGGLGWAGAALLVWLVPVTHCTRSLACQPKAKPIYARAIARIKLGKYRDAEQEVLQQLEKREDDFDGWMMLAELYATQFGDLAEADRTVRSVCDQPNVTALQVSVALHRLADWYLKLGDNPIAARRALAELCQRLPGSHFAQAAAMELQHLPESRERWIEQKKPKAIRLPALSGELDEPIPKSGGGLSRSDALSLVQECVERLKRNPNEISPREQLARLFTEQLNKPDLGIEQLELLLGIREAPEAKKPEWLSLLAVWQFRHRHDRITAKRLLEQLIHEYPQSVQGFAAQRWLNLLDTDERMHPVQASI